MDPRPLDTVPNLDSMDSEDLRAYATRISRGRPNSLARDLALYARRKADAIEARAAGLIWSAFIREADCGQIYNRIPLAIRW